MSTFPGSFNLMPCSSAEIYHLCYFDKLDVLKSALFRAIVAVKAAVAVSEVVILVIVLITLVAQKTFG